MIFGSKIKLKNRIEGAVENLQSREVSTVIPTDNTLPKFFPTSGARPIKSPVSQRSQSLLGNKEQRQTASSSRPLRENGAVQAHVRVMSKRNDKQMSQKMNRNEGNLITGN